MPLDGIHGFETPVILIGKIQKLRGDISPLQCNESGNAYETHNTQIIYSHTQHILIDID